MDIRDFMAEAQKNTVPTFGWGGDERRTKPGGFKVSGKAIDGWKAAGHDPEDLMFKRVRDVVNEIPRQKLGMAWGIDNDAHLNDTQDFIAGKPRNAFNVWMRNLQKLSPKLAKYIRRAPENVPIIYYMFMIRVSGKMMAKEIFNKYFKTMNESEDKKSDTKDILGTISKLIAQQIANDKRASNVKFIMGNSRSGGSMAMLTFDVGDMEVKVQISKNRDKYQAGIKSVDRSNPGTTTLRDIDDLKRFMMRSGGKMVGKKIIDVASGLKIEDHYVDGEYLGEVDGTGSKSSQLTLTKAKSIIRKLGLKAEMAGRGTSWTAEFSGVGDHKFDRKDSAEADFDKFSRAAHKAGYSVGAYVTGYGSYVASNGASGPSAAMRDQLGVGAYDESRYEVTEDRESLRKAMKPVVSRVLLGLKKITSKPKLLVTKSDVIDSSGRIDGGFTFNVAIKMAGEEVDAKFVVHIVGDSYHKGQVILPREWGGVIASKGSKNGLDALVDMLVNATVKHLSRAEEGTGHGDLNRLVIESSRQRPMDRKVPSKDSLMEMVAGTMYLSKTVHERDLCEANRSRSTKYNELSEGKSYSEKIVGKAYRLQCSRHEFLLEELPVKGKRKLKVMRLQNPGGILAEKSEFLYQNILRFAKIAPGDSYDTAKNKLLKSMSEAISDAKVDKRTWFHPREELVYYLNVEPEGVEPVKVDAKDFVVNVEWTTFDATSPSSDMQASDPSYSKIVAKSPGAARKLYKIIRANEAALRSVPWSKFDEWLNKKKIGFEYQHSQWR